MPLGGLVVFIRAIVVVGVITAFLAFARPVMASHDDAHGQFCGAPRPYVCGEILVILEESASDGIEPVMIRQGGRPDADLLDELEGVRDLLAPTGEDVDMSPTVVYLVAVRVGQEQSAAETYAADEAVYAAGVNRETIGTLTPDTAVPHPAAPPWPELAIVLLAVVAMRRVAAAYRLG